MWVIQIAHAKYKHLGAPTGAMLEIAAGNLVSHFEDRIRSNRATVHRAIAFVIWHLQRWWW